MVDAKILELIEGKYRKEYAKKHGIGSLINVFHGLHWKDEESEKVYKICLEKGITWQEYYGIDTSIERIY